MRFEKWQALGNDYVIVEREELPWELTPTRIRRICQPHFGVGSDGILLLGTAGDSKYVAELRIFNPDGSEAELSGNGAREAVLYLRSHGWTEDETFTIVTKAGEVTPTITGPGTVSMAIGKAAVRSDDYPSGPEDGTGTISSAGREWAFQHVQVGNPQCAIEVPDGLERLDLADDRPRDRGQHAALPQPHERLLLVGGRLDGPGPHLRARGGGDALLRHGSERCGRRGASAGGHQPNHGEARRRRADR